MDDLTRLAISKKTLYTHFDNKSLVPKVHLQFLTLFAGKSRRLDNAIHPIEELYTVETAVLKYYQNEASSPVYELQKYYPEIYL